VGVALGGADLGVAEEATDHFQRCAARDEQLREGVAEVVDADIGDLGDLLHFRPETLGITDGLIGDVTVEEERAAMGHRITTPDSNYDGTASLLSLHLSGFDPRPPRIPNENQNSANPP
jgi:hypothetical protein